MPRIATRFRRALFSCISIIAKRVEYSIHHMNAGELLKQDLLKVLKSLEYRFDVASEFPTDSGRVYLSFEDVSKTDMKYEDFETALRYLGKTFDGLEVVHVYDYVNENADIEATYIGYVPSFAEVALPKEFKEMVKIYRTKVSPDTFQKPIELSGMDVSFNDESGIILIGNRECALPAFKNGHFFCRVMFRRQAGEPVDWSIVFKEMNEFSPPRSGRDDPNADKKSVQDTMYAVNKRVKKLIPTEDDLFRAEGKSVKRNF